MNILEVMTGKSVGQSRMEIVERKGIGHPDTLCDNLMEAVSVALSSAYHAACGEVLHHNIDKGLLEAGQVDKYFGGGEVRQPMELTIGDRATFEVAGRQIPVADIAIDAAKHCLKKHLPLIDPDRHVRFRVVLAPGSAELSDIFARKGAIHDANDTSAAVGFFPFTPCEQAVLTLETYLNGARFKAAFPQTGQDVKVMGLRQGRNLDITVAMPLLAKSISSEQAYFSEKQRILDAMLEHLGSPGGFRKVRVFYNNLDQKRRGLSGVYLSLLGTSAEDADSGQVGRGNRVNGLISVNRPLGTEAAAGKNPVSHVGKIYNVLAHQLARVLYEQVDGLTEVYVLLLSRIGAPINRPQGVNVQLRLQRGQRLVHVRTTVNRLIDEALDNLPAFCQDLAHGRYPIC